MKLPVAHSERGQSAVIVALLLVALVGMLALALDGGNAFFTRRWAQNAADAGALAGAREWCISQNATSAVNRAKEYAVTRNGAMQADVLVNGGLVTVSTYITMQTTFGAVLGTPHILVGAVAAAGCFAPGSGSGIFPAAFPCPIRTDPVTGKQTCNLPSLFGDPLIVMDSEKTGADVTCQNPPGSGQPPGAINCDPDNDGLNDYIAGGDRSWLDLTGSGGSASSLSNWINGGCNCTINIDTWLGGVTGTDTSVFQTVANHVGTTVVVPVFDKYCNQQGLPQNVCPSEWSTGDTVIVSPGTSTLYYHIITFATFYITCVDWNGNGQVVAAAGISPVGHPPRCPVENLDKNANLIVQNDKTIEGYFIKEVPQGISGRPGGGVDGGAYTLYLTQ